jgi:monofunctional chorismate mutase
MSDSSPAGGIAAVRGAVPVPANTARDIQESTARLLRTLVEVNGLDPARIVSAVFTTTADLDADFPAHAARRLGWTEVPMLNAREIPVPGSMPRVVRVLLTVSGVAPGTRLRPVYLDSAAALRPDLTPVVSAVQPDRAQAGGAAARRLAIIGLGQIGGSIGLSLAGGAWHRVGWDMDARTREQAFAAGAVDEVADSLADACKSAALAVIATPVDTLPGLIAEAAEALPKGAALLDTGSTRADVSAAISAAAARGVRAVGGHPIAGNEGHGFASARAGMFRSAVFALCPDKGGVPEIVRAMIFDLGARELELSADAHDHALARTSHLPYLVACAIQEVGATYASRGLSGSGFRDMTRLAASNARVAGAFCRANAREVMAAWRELREAIERRLSELAG